jgi:hypothetical protein
MRYTVLRVPPHRGADFVFLQAQNRTVMVVTVPTFAE